MTEQLLDEVEQNIVPVAIRSFLAETKAEATFPRDNDK